MLDFWALPGPRTLVGATWDGLRDGRCVVVYAPNSLVPDLAQPVLDTATQEGYDVIRLDGEAAEVEDSLAAAAGLKTGWLKSGQPLLRYPAFITPTLYTVSVDVSQWPKWRSFLEDYSQYARNIDVHDRPRLLIVILGALSSGETDIGDGQIVQRREWTSVLGYFDTAAYVASRLSTSGLSPLRMRLLTSAATELAKWDLDLAEKLLGLDAAVLSDPRQLLREYASSKGWAADRAPCWIDSTEERYEGRRERHSAWLAAAGYDDEIRSRLWAAQAAVILPLIERERIRLAREVWPLLEGHALSTRSEDDLLGVEIGPLCDLLFDCHIARRFSRRASLLRTYRNMLAHLEIIPFEELWHSRLLGSDSSIENQVGPFGR